MVYPVLLPCKQSTTRILGKCFLKLSQLRVVVVPYVKSFVVILRNYASLWLRLPSSNPSPTGESSLNGWEVGSEDAALREFAEEYLATIPPEIFENYLIVYHEDLKKAEGTLPDNLLKLWSIDAKQSDGALERIEQLRQVARSCNETDTCESAACRNLAELQNP